MTSSARFDKVPHSPYNYFGLRGFILWGMGVTSKPLHTNGKGVMVVAIAIRAREVEGKYTLTVRTRDRQGRRQRTVRKAVRPEDVPTGLEAMVLELAERALLTQAGEQSGT